MTSVLLADDDPFIRRISEVSLRRAGFTVRSVADGTEALDAIEQAPVDLVILDGQMPTMDGLEVCRQLKSNPRTSRLPVIMLTARTEAADRDEGLAAGAAGYITKPFDPATLGAQVRRIVERQTAGTAADHDAA